MSDLETFYLSKSPKKSSNFSFKIYVLMSSIKKKNCMKSKALSKYEKYHWHFMPISSIKILAKEKRNCSGQKKPPCDGC